MQVVYRLSYDVILYKAVMNVILFMIQSHAGVGWSG